ncbi:MAG TPA: ROK family protein [Candidatus Bathyarchaeia archaeon]|nr:ROK family protein [Candidatus Bathyarchaeia archaeon]
MNQPQHNFLLALEIGGTKLQAALGTPEGEILQMRRGPVPQGGPPAILDWFAGQIPTLIQDAEKPVRAIGIGFGGPVDSAAGRVLVSHQVEGWKDLPLAQWFQNQFRIPTRLFNDSNAAGWAEFRLGAGRGTRHFLYSNIGSGIGGAIVIDGRLHDGQGFGAGEVGHTWVVNWEKLESCEMIKLENICSGWAIERRIRAWKNLQPNSPLHKLANGDPANLTCAILGQAARNRDPRALDEIDRVAKSIATALANTVTLFHPEKIALGGGVSLLGDVLLDPIRQYADQLVFGPFQGRVQIVPCQLAESVVLAGALLLAGAGAKNGD